MLDIAMDIDSASRSNVLLIVTPLIIYYFNLVSFVNTLGDLSSNFTDLFIYFLRLWVMIRFKHVCLTC